MTQFKLNAENKGLISQLEIKKNRIELICEIRDRLKRARKIAKGAFWTFVNSVLIFFLLLDTLDQLYMHLDPLFVCFVLFFYRGFK